MSSSLRFGIEIAATDTTRGAWNSVLSQAKRATSVLTKPIAITLKAATGGLGLLRDINVGLRPAVVALDNLIERGAALETIQKSFAKLAGVKDGQARGLAQWLKEQANGTIKLSQAMELANRAMASGMNLRDLGIAIDFVSKKAVTTGKNAAEALNTVITGLSRGSTLFLDDFGILVDGIDGVRTAFDKLKGKGAFDALAPSAQKAEIIRQALAEMQVAMGRMGVTGKELVFTWQSIKTGVGDAVDSLVAAIGRSKALKEALESTRDLLGRLQVYFEKGGSFKKLIFGDDKGGGLVGVIKGALFDAGENLGRGIAASLLDASAFLLENIPKAFDWVWDKAKETFKPLLDAIDPLVKALGEFAAASWAFVAESRQRAIEAIAQKAQNLALTNDAQGRPALRGGAIGWGFDRVQMLMENPALGARQIGEDIAGAATPLANWFIRLFGGRGDGRLDRQQWRRDSTGRPVPIASVPGFPGVGTAAAAALAAGAGGMFAAQEPTAAEKLREHATQIRAGIGWGRTSAAVDSFNGMLPNANRPESIAPTAPPEQHAEQDGGLASQYALRPEIVRQLRGQRLAASRRYARAWYGGADQRRRAFGAAQEEIRGIAEQGYLVTPAQRRSIFERQLGGIRKSEMQDALGEVAGIDEQLDMSDRAARGLPPRPRPAAGSARSAQPSGSDQQQARGGSGTKDELANAIRKQVDAISEQTSKLDELVKALIGGGREIARARR